MKKLVLLTAVASVAVAASAFAATNNGVYAGVNGGVAIPAGTTAQVDGISGTGFSKLVKTGFDLGGQVGYRFNKNFRAELAASYLRNSLNTFNGLLQNSSHLNSGLFMANGYYDIDLGSAVVPFVGAGIGDIYQHGYVNTVIGNVNKSENDFAYQGIAGVAYNVSQNVSVDVDYHYVGWKNSNGASQNLVNLGLNYYFA